MPEPMASRVSSVPMQAPSAAWTWRRSTPASTTIGASARVAVHPGGGASMTAATPSVPPGTSSTSAPWATVPSVPADAKIRPMPAARGRHGPIAAPTRVARSVSMRRSPIAVRSGTRVAIAAPSAA